MAHNNDLELVSVQSEEQDVKISCTGFSLNHFEVPRFRLCEGDWLRLRLPKEPKQRTELIDILTGSTHHPSVQLFDKATDAQPYNMTPPSALGKVLRLLGYWTIGRHIQAVLRISMEESGRILQSIGIKKDYSIDCCGGETRILIALAIAFQCSEIVAFDHCVEPPRGKIQSFVDRSRPGHSILEFTWPSEAEKRLVF